MSFGSILFTTKGKMLQAKAQAGKPLTFTKLALGDGELNGQSISELNALKNKKLEVSISSVKVLVGGIASVGGTFTNQSLDVGFYWREIGLFANDPDLGEILYCYGNAGALAEYIPASGGSQILEKRVNIETTIGDAENVSAVIDSSLVYASLEDVEAHNLDSSAHQDIRTLIQNIDVKTDVEEVVNRRLNPDTSKSLSTLISGWIDLAKTAILNAIGLLPQKSVWTDARGAKLDNLNQSLSTTQTNITTHISSKVDGLPQKAVWTDVRGAKLDNLNQSLSATQTNIQTTVNQARDNNNATIYSVRDEIKGVMVNRTFEHEFIQLSAIKIPYNSIYTLKTYSNVKGGVAKINLKYFNSTDTLAMLSLILIVDGRTVIDKIFIDNLLASKLSSRTGEEYFPLEIPFKNSFSIQFIKDEPGTSGTLSLSLYAGLNYYING